MGISLDGSKLDKTNPSYQIIWYQQITGKQWGILTDGRYWRLYSTRAQSKFTTFYEVNIEKLLVERDDERFKYFFNMFRKEAFVRGQENNRSFLDVVFESGEHYAREVETRLKDRAFHLVELICQGFLSAKKSPSQEELNDVYQHSLFYLFRLMFILNCEARELLSVDKQDDYYSLSLRALCYRLREENDRNQKWSGQPRSYNCISDLLRFSRMEMNESEFTASARKCFHPAGTPSTETTPFQMHSLIKCLSNLPLPKKKRLANLSTLTTSARPPTTSGRYLRDY